MKKITRIIALLLIGCVFFASNAFAVSAGDTESEAVAQASPPAGWRAFWVREYDKGSLQSGDWRNGPTGAGACTISMSQSNSSSYNLSFTAKLSGTIGDKSKVGADLGVTVGASKTYGITSTYSCTVKAGETRTIQYRPLYYHVKVTEIEYWERLPSPGFPYEKYEASRTTGYVDVFSNWGFQNVAGTPNGAVVK